jgi:hypothetical protein
MSQVAATDGGLRSGLLRCGGCSTSTGPLYGSSCCCKLVCENCSVAHPVAIAYQWDSIKRTCKIHSSSFVEHCSYACFEPLYGMCTRNSELYMDSRGSIRCEYCYNRCSKCLNFAKNPNSMKVYQYGSFHGRVFTFNLCESCSRCKHCCECFRCVFGCSMKEGEKLDSMTRGRYCVTCGLYVDVCGKCTERIGYKLPTYCVHCAILCTGCKTVHENRWRLLVKWPKVFYLSYQTRDMCSNCTHEMRDVVSDIFTKGYAPVALHICSFLTKM